MRDWSDERPGKRVNHLRAAGRGALSPVAALVLTVIPAPLAGDPVGSPPRLSVTIVSGPEVLFDARRDGCDREDIPDIPLRVFRRNDGQLVGFASHYTTRAFMIDPAGAFRRDCATVLASDKNPDPSQYADRTWIAATWTDDGRTVIALGHNEFQANQHRGACAYREYMQCWYNSIVLLKSTDGGRSFLRVPGARPIANANFTHKERQGAPRGFFEPTNILKNDRFFYTLIYTSGADAQRPGTCLFRARRLDEDSAWEYWTGDTFVRSARDPYREVPRPDTPCQPLRNLGQRVWSIARHQPSGLFLAVVAVQPPGAQSGLVQVSVSSDLMRWSMPTTVLSVPTIWSSRATDEQRFGYAAMIDLASRDRNFGEVGDSPGLYMTQIDVVRGTATLSRRLIRYRLDLRLEP
jgi:hypothetical protein